MNSLASILYSSSTNKKPKRKNLSLQPSRCQVGMLFRSSTPKTPLKTTITTHPKTLSTSSSISVSMNSPQSPRCSTPLYSKQRRTRPFIVCELCRQRAYQSVNKNTDNNQIDKPKHDKQQNSQFSYRHHSATLHYYQYQTSPISSSNSIRHRCNKRRSSIDQLLVWIL